MIINIDAVLFDGTTSPPATATLVQQPDGTYLYSDGGNPFAAIGLLPWSVIKGAVGGATGDVLYAKSYSTATSAEISLMLDGKPIVVKAWNPAQQPTRAGFPVTNTAYSIGLKTNQVEGNQTWTMDIVPDDVHAVAPPSAEELYGADDASARDVASRVIGPLIASAAVAAGDLVLYDTSAGAITIDLPAAPELGDVVLCKEVANSAVNAMNVNGNGKDLEVVAGGTAASTAYQVASGWIGWVYIGSNTWMIYTLR